MAALTFSEAAAYAKTVLEHKQASDPNRWIQKTVISKNDSAVFWWNDEIPLIEILLWDAVKRAPDGYFLISGDKRLPPMLEYSDTGASLSHQVQWHSAAALYHSQLDWRLHRIHYATSTAIYLEFLPVDGTTHVLNVPNLTVSRFTKIFGFDRKPEDIFDQNIVAELWRQYTPGGVGDVPAIVLPFLTPVKYNQGCDGYSTQTASCRISTSGQTYCSPHAIMGCVPVAWALLMCAWKRSGFFGASRIWGDSTCWAHDWPSYTGYANPSQCALVESTIWKLHSMMGTTHDGSTSGNATIQGAKIFSDYGLNWNYGQALSQPFEFAIRVIQAGQPLLWTAQGTWSPGEKPDGHGVVSYGYQKSDRSLYVGLGWGASYTDKYIFYDQYSQNDCFFMTGHAAAKAADGGILTII